DLAGARARNHGPDYLVGAVIGNYHFEFHFGQQIHLVFHAAIDLLVPFLTAMAADFRDGHAVDADGLERFLDVFEFVRLDDGFYFFHDVGYRLRFEIISFFAVHADVQALQLMLGRDADAENQVANLENEPGSCHRQDPRNQYAEKLVEHLACVTVYQPE